MTKTTRTFLCKYDKNNFKIPLKIWQKQLGSPCQRRPPGASKPVISQHLDGVSVMFWCVCVSVCLCYNGKHNTVVRCWCNSVKSLCWFHCVYFSILISHIILSIIVIPFVLITYVRAITKNIELHKKIAKYTFPLWLYVTISGVLVYYMISPYYSLWIKPF